MDILLAWGRTRVETLGYRQPLLRNWVGKEFMMADHLHFQRTLTLLRYLQQAVTPKTGNAISAQTGPCPWHPQQPTTTRSDAAAASQ